MSSPGNVVLFTLGGTISMAGSESGVVARLGGADLLAAVGRQPYDVEVRDLRAVPSSTPTFADVLDVVDQARAAVAEGALGIVLTQGTDTLEETALRPSWSTRSGPRQPRSSSPGRCATRPCPAQTDRPTSWPRPRWRPRPRPARVVPWSSSTTRSTPRGTSARRTPRARRPSSLPTWDRWATSSKAFRVCWRDCLLANRSPTSPGTRSRRPGSRCTPSCSKTTRQPSPVFTATYGAPGSERDLRERGLLDGGFVHPYKARILLRLLVASGADTDEIAAAFAALG